MTCWGYPITLLYSCPCQNASTGQEWLKIMDRIYDQKIDIKVTNRRRDSRCRGTWARGTTVLRKSRMSNTFFWPHIRTLSLNGKMSTSFHSFSSHSSQNESGMRKWPKNDNFRPEWDWPHPSHFISFISFWGHPKPRMTVEWGKTSFSSHFRGITKPNFPSSEKCFNFGTVGIKGQTNDTEWLENDKNESKMRWMTVEWYEWV